MDLPRSRPESPVLVWSPSDPPRTRHSRLSDTLHPWVTTHHVPYRAPRVDRLVQTLTARGTRRDPPRPPVGTPEKRTDCRSGQRYRPHVPGPPGPRLPRITGTRLRHDPSGSWRTGVKGVDMAFPGRTVDKTHSHLHPHPNGHTTYGRPGLEAGQPRRPTRGT